MTTTTAFDVTMPQLGETVSEGTVIDWLIGVGGEVAAGDALLEVSTDKVDTELPSPVSGVLMEVLATAGETVAVGAVIGRIAVDGDVGEAGPTPPVASSPASQAVRAPVTPPQPPTPPAMLSAAVATSDSDRLRVSPVARRLADERRIDLNTMVGTGQDGAIVKRDVLRTASSKNAEATLVTGTHPATSITAQTDIDMAGIIAASTDHLLAAFVIRALVDSLRREAANHPALATFVEPGVRYVRASTGQSAALPDAAGLRLSALTTRLDTLASDPATRNATVTILDSSDQSCIISGAMSSALSVSIGPRQTKPTIATSGTGVAIVFSEMVDVSVTAEESLIPVQALAALTTHLKQVLETRDWSTEV